MNRASSVFFALWIAAASFSDLVSAKPSSSRRSSGFQVEEVGRLAYQTFAHEQRNRLRSQALDIEPGSRDEMLDAALQLRRAAQLVGAHDEGALLLDGRAAAGALFREAERLFARPGPAPGPVPPPAG